MSGAIYVRETVLTGMQFRMCAIAVNTVLKVIFSSIDGCYAGCIYSSHIKPHVFLFPSICGPTDP